MENLKKLAKSLKNAKKAAKRDVKKTQKKLRGPGEPPSDAVRGNKAALESVQAINIVIEAIKKIEKGIQHLVKDTRTNYRSGRFGSDADGAFKQAQKHMDTAIDNYKRQLDIARNKMKDVKISKYLGIFDQYSQGLKKSAYALFDEVADLEDDQEDQVFEDRDQLLQDLLGDENEDEDLESKLASDNASQYEDEEYEDEDQYSGPAGGTPQGPASHQPFPSLIDQHAIDREAELNALRDQIRRLQARILQLEDTLRQYGKDGDFDYDNVYNLYIQLQAEFQRAQAQLQGMSQAQNKHDAEIQRYVLLLQQARQGQQQATGSVAEKDDLIAKLRAQVADLERNRQASAGDLNYFITLRQQISKQIQDLFGGKRLDLQHLPSNLRSKWENWNGNLQDINVILNDLVVNLNTSQRQVADLTGQLQTITRERNHWKREAERLATDMEQIRREQAERERRHKDEITQLRAQHDRDIQRLNSDHERIVRVLEERLRAREGIDKKNVSQREHQLVGEIGKQEQTIQALRTYIVTIESERNNAGANVDALTRELKEAKAREQDLLEQLRKLRESEHNVSAGRSETKRQYELIVIERQGLNQTIIELRAEIDKIREDYRKQIAQLSAGGGEATVLIQARLDALTRESKTTIQDLTTRLQQAESERTAVNQQLRQLQRDYQSAQDTIADLRAQIARLEARGGDVKASSETVARLKNELHQAQSERNEFEQELIEVSERTTHEIQRLKQLVSERDHELEIERKRTSAAMHERDELSERLEAVQAELRTVRSDLNSANSDIQRLQREAEVLQHELAARDQIIARLRRELTNRSDGLARLEDHDHNLDIRVQSLTAELGSQTDLVTSLRDQLRRQGEELEGARQTITDLERALSEQRALVRRLERQAQAQGQEGDDQDQALKTAQARANELQQQLTLEQARTQRLMDENRHLTSELRNVSAERDAYAQELDSLREIRADLQEKIGGLRKENGDLSDHIDHLNAETHKLESFLQNRDNSIQELQEQVRTLEQTNRELVQENRRLEDENRRLTEENQGLTEENRRLTDDNEGLTAENRRLENANGDLERDNDHLRQDRDRLQAELERAQADVDADQQQRLSEVEAERNALQDEVDNFGAERDELRARNDELTRDRDGWRQRALDAEQRNNDMVNALRDSQDAQRRMADDLLRAQQAIEQIQAERNADRERFRQAIEAERNRYAALHAEATAAINDRDTVIGNLRHDVAAITFQYDNALRELAAERATLGIRTTERNNARAALAAETAALAAERAAHALTQAERDGLRGRATDAEAQLKYIKTGEGTPGTSVPTSNPRRHR